MESLSRPPHRRKHSSFSPYDDVVLLPKKAAAAKPLDAREYAEIFSGSSSTTSIPVLDLSGLDERVGSSESGRLDYSSIFGGFRNDDVAVPYEELFSTAKRTKTQTQTQTRPPKDPRSTLQESGSPSEKAKSSSVEASGQSIDGVKKPFNVTLDPRSTLQESGSPSEKAKSSSVEASGQSIDGVKKQFNVSFNKTSQINSDLTNGKTHIAQFHAVPGFTYFVDQTPRPQKKEDIKPVPSLKRGVSRTWSFSAEVETLKGKGGLHIPEKSHDVNEINLKPHPLSVPLPSTCPANPNGNKDPGGSRVSTFASKEDTSLKTVAEHSPPPLDEDLDENSVAGVSAAALKKAIEQAQESIRIAKIIMERKKGGLENGSKPRSKGRLKVEDKKETRVDRESYGTKEKNVRQKSERFDSVVPALSGFDGKLSRPLSRNEKDNKRGEVDVERVWENVDAAREHREPVGDDTKNIQSSSLSGTYRFAEKTEVEKQGRNVEAGTEHTEPFSSVVEKNGPSRSPSYADHCSEKVEFDKKQGENVKSVEALSETTDFTGLLATSELRVANSVSGQMANNENLRLSMNSASLTVESGAGKETSGQGEATFHLAKIPEVVVQLARSTFQKMPTLRKSVTEISEQRQGAADHSQRAENVSELVEWVFSTTEIQPHQGKNMDEEYANMKISQEDKVIEEGENAADDIEKREKKIQEVEEMDNWEYARELRSEFNTSFHEPRNLIEKDILDQEKMTKKSDSVPDWKDNDLSNGLRYEEKENGMEQIVTHQWLESETQLEEDLKEQTAKKELKASPKTGEVEAEATSICEPEIDDRELSHDEDGPNLPVELEQIEKREPNSFGYAAVKGVDIEANSRTELQLDGEIQHMEEANHSPGGAVNSEHKHYECDIQKVTCEKNNDEAFVSSGTDAATVCNDTYNNETSTMLYESQEAHSVNRPEELLKTFESFTADIGGVPEAFSANKDKGVEQLFPLGDIKMSETDCLRRSVSEENFVGSKLQNALEALSSDRKKDNVGFMDANHEELQKTRDTFTNDGLHDVAMESRQNLPEIHPSNNTAEFHLTGVEQTSESEEGSVSISSTENTESILANEYQGCEENANGETLNTREARDDIGTTSRERKCNEEQTDAVHSEELSEGTDSEEQSEGGVESEEQSEGVDNEEQSELVNYEDKSEGVNSEVQREESHSQSHIEPTEMDKSLETRRSLETEQNIEKTKENITGTSTMVEKDAKESTDNFDKDGQQQRIEAIKRGREREKDRLAVERAIREARERAFAEARERAERAAVERAAAEARQRAMTEAREKLEKASTEAKIRAERAAVERATSEARERALEKAMSQKATTDSRTQIDRINTERYSCAARDNGLKHSLSSSDLDKYSEANTESAQRRNLRLERHQRIMERAAKALAEKNMRDLVAQKEQAERNRLAESLDTEIKRWASGKEGNLRALLSTLQYILGPDSGWQPITLTEIITTAAVKKAYRKATLYVHPDKLQQRGATIKQKYVCEKIFDLLKAAWNRFNSEER